MDFTELNRKSYTELKDIATTMDIPIRRSKADLLKGIIKAFKEYETYKKEKLDKYTRGNNWETKEKKVLHMLLPIYKVRNTL